MAPMPHQVPQPADQATKQQGCTGEVHATAEVETVLVRVVAAACEARQGELARSPRAPRQQHGAKAKESKVQASGFGEEAVTCRRIYAHQGPEAKTIRVHNHE